MLHSGVQIARSAGLRYVNDDEPGIVRLRCGRGFKYLLPGGRPIRSPKALRRIERLAIPPAYTHVWICRDQDGHIQAVGRDKRGRKQYRYHADWRAARDRTKFQRMVEFAAALPRLREQVARDLATTDLTKQKVVAAIIRLLDGTAIRIGNEEYAKANNSFGITTLQNRHATVNGDTIRLRFRGKSGKEREVGYRDRRVARVLSRCQDVPGHRLFEFRDDRGSVQTITSTDVNEYLQKHAGGDFSAKDFRTWHGSLGFALAASHLLTGNGQPKEGPGIVNSALTAAAKKLGNTPAVCKKSYIHPALLQAVLAGKLPGFRGSRNTRNHLRLTVEEAKLQRFLLKRRINDQQ